MPLRVTTRSISSTTFGKVLTNADELSDEAVGNVGAHAADARERRREARADPRLEQLVDLLALLERPEERRERADVDAGRAEPDQVRDDARHLARHDAQHLAPLRDLDAEQPLGAEREGDVVAGRVEIILTVGPRDDLIVLPVLADLLEAAVQVADVRNAAHDRLAVELEHEAQHAVRRRMLRPDVDEHVLTRRAPAPSTAAPRARRRCRSRRRRAARAAGVPARRGRWSRAATSTVRFVVAIVYSPVRSPVPRRRRMSAGRSSNASAIDSSSLE